MNDTISKYDLMSVCTVSRETIDRLEVYAGLLEKWNSTINLVSKNTINQMWKRHFLDSAQLWPHIPSETKTLVDIGSGAGFAGLVLAIIGMEKSPNMKFTLIESDSRKCAFMRNVSREINLDVQIITKRIEEVTDIKADVITARALATVSQLLEYSKNILKDNGVCLFLKEMHVVMN
jgi:16S rRNA (guanine527-N7)-methyltransferase